MPSRKFLRTFDPNLFDIIIAGYVVDDVDKEFLSVAYDYNTFDLVTGIDGEACRVRNKNKSGTITIRLLQSSVTNDVFTALSVIDNVTGFGVLPLLAKEKGGISGTTIFSPSVFIEKIPDVTISNNHEVREWRFRTDNMLVFLSGFPLDISGTPTALEEFVNNLNPVRWKV